MSDVLVKYNNVTLPTPTPYVSVNNEIIRYGTRFASVNKITLNGQITGTSFAALAAAQSGLVNIFSTGYKTLTITEGVGSATDAIAFSGCSFESISFDSSRYNRVVPYSIELMSYPSGDSFFGILEPKDEIKISAGNDGFGTVSHSVSAKGFSIGNADTAINSAKNFVTGRSASGLAKIAAMSKLGGSSTAFTPILVNVSENLNRLDLTYSLEKSYKFKLVTGALGYNFNKNFLTSYSTTLSSGAGEDFVTATIRGQIRYPTTGAGTLSDLYTELSSLNPYSVVSGTYGSPNGLAFCADPISFSVIEDSGARKINFNASYDNSEFYGTTNDAYSYGGCYFDAQTSCSVDELTKTITVDVKGEVKCRGSRANRFTSSSGYLEQFLTSGTSLSAPRIYDFANSFYTAYLGDSTPLFTLNIIPNSLEVTSNAQLGVASVSASFDNKDKLDSLASSDYSIQYTPYNTVYSFASSCNDSIKHLVVDMNTQKRESVSLDIQIADPGSTELSLLNSKIGIFGNFETNFIAPLTLPGLDSLQKETSTSSVGNSYGLGNTQVGSTVSASCGYSFELSSTELATRKIIKSQ